MRMHASIHGFGLPTAAHVERSAALLRLLADPTRLKILHALQQGESHVGCLVELCGANQSTVSQHLAKLRLAGVITPRRAGTQIYYTLDDRLTALLLDTLWGYPETHSPGPVPRATTSDPRPSQPASANVETKVDGQHHALLPRDDRPSKISRIRIKRR